MADHTLTDFRTGAWKSASEFHDALLEDVSYTTASGELRLSFEAEEFETGKSFHVSYFFSDVLYLTIEQPARNPALEDYHFPRSVLIDRVALDVSEGHTSYEIEGTYGWKLRFVTLGSAVRESGGADVSDTKSAELK